MASITSTNQTVLSASAFTSSIGVNTHVSYAWGSYNNLALVEADLKYLGVTTLRDSLTNIPAAQPVLDGLANDGYKFDLGVSSSIPAAGAAGLQQYVAALDAFQAAHPGSIIALEGLNEANLQAFSYNGSSTIEAAAQFQQALYTAIKADASLAKLPVYNLTLGYDDPNDFAKLGNLGSSSDYANSHAYVSTGTTPGAAVAAALNLASSVSPGDPSVITETGYTTLSTTPFLGVDEAVQAKSILNTLMDAFKDGVGKTYLYELLDRNSSSSDTNAQSHFGLFYDDGTPKLAATAVHNLTTILNDDGTGNHQPTTPLNYTLSNMPDSGNSMVLGKSNGAYDLVVWAEPKVWDPKTSTEITNPSQTVTVQLDSVHQSIKVYDPTGGTDPIATYTNVSSFTVPVSDHPIIIEIDGVSNAASNPTQATDVTGTAATIVAELADLSASTTLHSITLTDTHVLAVASVSTMNYIISHYGNALAAIQGGYSFSVTTSTTSWSETKFFSATGTQTGTSTSNFTNGVITSKSLVNVDGTSDTVLYSTGVKAQETIVSANGTKQTTNYNSDGSVASETIKNTDGSLSTAVYTNGLKSKTYVTNADGTHTNTFYGITGQAYATQILITKADGTVTSITNLHADGTTQYTKVTNADGSTTTDLYNSAGQKTSEVRNYTDGSSATTNYDTSGVVTQTVAKAAGATTTTNYSAGVQVSVYITSADGTKETKLFTGGQIASDFVQKTDGSSTTTVFANGVKSKVYVTNIDGSHASTTYNITGQPYTTQIQTARADGTVTSITNLHADGTTQYTKVLNGDGSTTTGIYNTAGQKTSEVRNYADGSSVTTNYNTSSVVTQTVAKATDGTTTTTNLSAGVQTSIYITSADGTKESELFTNGQIASDLVQKTDGSSTMTVYTSGVKSKIYVTNADGTHTNTFYNVTGQAYTTEIQKTKADGTITAITDLHADGTLQYTKVVNADGSVTTDQYDGAGHKTSEVLNHTDGSTLTSTYDTTGNVTQTVAKAGGDSTTTNFSSGVKTSVYITNADGSKESDLYTAGHLTSTLIQKTDGSSSTTVYSNDIKTATYETHADGTHTNTAYNVTGKAYTTEIQQSKADGTITSITDLHADGTLQYTKVVNSDGSITTDLYDSTGHKTTEVQNYTDGSTLSSAYDTTGSVTQTVAKASGNTTTTNFSSGVKTSVYISNADGSKDTQTYSSGKIASDYVQNTDGSNATTVYADGVKAKMYVNNADGSHDNFYFNATNTEHDSYNTAGNLAYVDILNSDGTHNASAKVAGISLAGSAGNDTFAAAGVGSTTISFGGGNDTVNGFHAGSATGHDTVAIAKLMATDYSQLQLSQSGADTVIHVTANDTILLKNVVAANVTSSDFLFV
ncbi:beta strand repeat-containing protein [Bradyrhizobium sp. AZCC 2230]|uniref:beta strand repeat-containing protein n=1 Tax=Bradyrhizobium sp. AZCC 2230 TaxID=3117021 RepID=UPI002FF093F3